MKRSLSIPETLMLSDWVKFNVDFVKSADSVSQISIKASEDLGWPVSPSSIRALMSANGIERQKPQKQSLTIAQGLDRAEFDQLKKDVAFVAGLLLMNIAMSRHEADCLKEIQARNK